MEINWTEIIIMVVGLVFSAFIIPLLQAAFTWLKSKTKNEALAAALAEAETVAMNVVAGLQANVVEGLKAKSADGKLTTDEIQSLIQLAFSGFVRDLSKQSYDVITENADNIENWVYNLIQKKLAELKAGLPFVPVFTETKEAS